MTKELEHTYAEPGTYTITVTDSEGKTTTTEFVAEDPAGPNLVLAVPADQSAPTGEPLDYETRLTNDSDAAVDSVTETLRLTRDDDEPLTTGDVVYGTFDTGEFVEGQLTEDDGALVGSETYPVAAHLDATSQVRITINLPVGTVVNGRSEVADDSGDTLAAADYTFTVVEATG